MTNEKNYYNGRESDCGSYQPEIKNPPIQPHYKIPFSHELSWWFKWALLITVVALLCSCQHELYTGYYKIESVRGNTVNFVGVTGDYHVPVDTLKPGDRIFIRRTFKMDSATVWQP